ncbi:hypothetical protein GALMADRAFT_1317448 [Galerina marginata CBS 339.88]|uniref:DUF6535 domain-containing protein n=1 Tax=Galerina marginata (strain CBS 339.88) TaxID=685588 RepID=A0A067T5B2_GALM3|nr:hypothetical protein GALMADRAFT_1317448 [Galerina marginata CBS 339.88]
MWNIDDPFLYAPPKPEGDPWSILLEPLLKKDKIWCEAWKDEVQNLLIFAGLFSAVVTAFIIESYRNLQPNQDDAIISLLSQIATRLDNSTFTLPSSTVSLSTFTPTPSSIRVNTFWFLSLVLSLTTVLVGIVSLQWLREHQSYPNLTPKQTYALFNMRAESLQKWYVPRIFTLLPLLLQSALVLFLGGMIDFLLAFGDIIAIPVSVVIGSTVFFLAATTVLPTIQGFLLYLPFPYFGRRYPVQCPYKSPQSHAFRAMSRLGFRVCSQIYSPLRSFTYNIVHYTTQCSPATERSFEEDYFTRYILEAWERQTWTQFDLSWLSIRDAYLRRAYGRATKSDNLGHDLGEHIPLFDITRSLLASVQTRRDATQHNKFPFAAEYHCLAETSESFHSVWRTFKSWSGEDFQRQSGYFQDLLSGKDDKNLCLSDFFKSLVPRKHWEDINETRFLKTMAAFHHEALFTFLSRMHQVYRMENFTQLSMHRLELKLRLMGHFYQKPNKLRPLAYGSQPPVCLTIQGISEFPFEARSLKADPFVLQLAHIIYAYFKCAGDGSQQLAFEETFHSYSHLPRFMDLAFGLLSSTPGYDMPNYKALHACGIIHSSNFIRIANDLHHEMSIPFRGKKPSLLFYAAALYIREFPWYPAADSLSLQVLVSAMRKYKERTIDLGIVSETLEKLLGRTTFRFSESWWRFLDPEPLSDDTLQSASESVNSTSSSPVETDHTTILATMDVFSVSTYQGMTTRTVEPPDRLPDDNISFLFLPSSPKMPDSTEDAPHSKQTQNSRRLFINVPPEMGGSSFQSLVVGDDIV